MGKTVHYTAIQFLVDRMKQHDKVSRFEQMPNPNEHLFKISRPGGLPPVVVHYSDSYRYGIVDYKTRPTELKKNSFIVILPHGDYDADLDQIAKSDGILIGGVGKLMGALNLKKHMGIFDS